MVTEPMHVGQLARVILGKRFHSIAGLYRAAFVDLRAVAAVVAEALPPGSVVLDIGGGDGAALNYLLAMRSDIKVAMLDIAPSVGEAVEERHRGRVERFPATALETYSGPHADALLIMDVVHHIPESERLRFFDEIGTFARLNRVSRLIVKDMEPGHLRSTMGFLADRYISGDKHVRMMPVDRLMGRLRNSLGEEYTVTQTQLGRLDPANYCVVAYLR